MDDAVLASLRRWPNVPAVFGWLSLSARGQWRLHPDGQAMLGGAGESIQNSQIIGFIGRNYACDDQGRWFFQNGPQRVYARLDAAPWVVRVDTDTLSGQLVDQTGQTFASISAWVVDAQGNLFFKSSRGAGRILDRDLGLLAEALVTPSGQTLTQWWETDLRQDTTLSEPTGRWPACRRPAPLRQLGANERMADCLGYIANPHPSVQTP